MYTQYNIYYQDRTQGTLKTKKIVQRETAETNVAVSSKSKWTYKNR